jgi:hypothetical protein
MKILQIIPATVPAWAVYDYDETKCFNQVDLWALVEDDEGYRSVCGMTASGGVEFCEDEYFSHYVQGYELKDGKPEQCK